MKRFIALLILLWPIGVFAQPAAPIFTPGGGTYSQAQVVTIGCPGSSGWNAAYTTNGSTPTEGSTLYNSVINVNSTLTLKAICWVTPGTDSSVTTAAYTITPTYLDTTASGTTITLNGAVYHTKGHPQVWLDGPSGTLTGYISATTGHGRNQSTNPFLSKAQGNFNLLWAQYGFLNAGAHATPGVEAGTPALLWLANGGNNTNCGKASCGGGDADYLDAVKWQAVHPEEMWGGAFGCDQTSINCGVGQSGADQFNRPNVAQWATAYSIIRQHLTLTERQLIADKILNDWAQGPRTAAGAQLCGVGTYTGHCGNGLGGNSGSVQADAVSQPLNAGGSTTLTISGGTQMATYIFNPATDTPSTATFSSAWCDASKIGAALIQVTSESATPAYYGRIQACVGAMPSSTATLSRVETNITGKNFNWAPVWQRDLGAGIGHAGLVNHINHLEFSYCYVSGQESTWAQDYPLYDTGTGCLSGTLLSAARSDNQVYQSFIGLTAAALALVDDDVRAKYLLTEIYTWLYANVLSEEMTTINPFDHDGSNYSTGVNFLGSQIIPVMLCNSIVESTPCNAWSNVTSRKRIADFFLYMYLLYADNIANVDDYGGTLGINDSTRVNHVECLAQYLYPSSVDTQYLAYYQRTIQSVYNLGATLSDYDDYNFAFCDPATTQTNVSAAPTQFLFQGNDYTACTADTILNASGHCYTPLNSATFLSITGWTNNDTHLIGSSGRWVAGHVLSGDLGHYSIAKKDSDVTPYIGRLLGWDAGVNPYTAIPTANRVFNTIEIGSATWKATDGETLTSQAYGNIPRWAGTDPTGVSSNKYAYALLDLLGNISDYTSAANATRVQRHLVDFKSGPQYIVGYDDVAVSSAATIKAYYNYWLTPASTYSDFTAAPGLKTASVTHSTTNKLLSAFFSGDGNANHVAMVLDNANGSFPGGSGFTARATVCGSTDGVNCQSVSTYESIVVHRPTVTTTDVMPTLTQPACSATGGSCVTMQIADATTPKAAAFSRQGALVTGAAYTTTYSGTGQNVYAGLAAGSYNVTVNGSMVLSNTTVNNKDNTIYWESTAGAVVIGAGGGGGTPAFAISPASPFTYANTTMNGNTSQTFTISNSGSAGLVIGTLSVGDATHFIISADGCSGQTIAGPGGACMVNITFHPTAVTSYSTTLTVPDNVGNPDTVTLNGTGIAPAATSRSLRSSNLGGGRSVR